MLIRAQTINIQLVKMVDLEDLVVSNSIIVHDFFGLQRALLSMSFCQAYFTIKLKVQALILFPMDAVNPIFGFSFGGY